jgi:hypothetical protein
VTKKGTKEEEEEDKTRRQTNIMDNSDKESLMFQYICITQQEIEEEEPE